MEDSDIIVSAAVATAAPVEALPLPVVAIADCAAVRTALLAAALLALLLPLDVAAVRMVALALMVDELLAADASVLDRGGETGGVMAAGPVRTVGALTLPAEICVLDDPLGDPPEVLIQICFSMAGFCQ